MNVVFFGTSEAGLPTAKALLEKGWLKAIVTNPDALVGRKQILTPSPIATAFQDTSIPIYKPEKVKNNQELIEQLHLLTPDIFVVVSYGKILPESIIDLPKHKTVNVHFSLLPKYRGAAPVQWAIYNGEKITGSTIFLLDKNMDTGPVLEQFDEQILPSDTFESLLERLSEKSALRLIDVLVKYTEGDIAPTPQNHSDATYAPIIKKSDGRIDWSKSAHQIYDQWLAFQRWPGVWTTLGDQNLKIGEVEVSSESGTTAKPGTILPDGGVACGTGTLQINQLTPAGKNAMSMQNWINGNPSLIGKRLV